MNSLLTALATSYNGSTLKTLTTGYHAYPAPPKSPYPLVTWQILSGDPAYLTYDGGLEEIIIRTSVWSKGDSPAEAVTLGAYLRTWLDNAPLILPGETLVQTDWEIEALTPDPDGGFVFHTEYKYTIDKVLI